MQLSTDAHDCDYSCNRLHRWNQVRGRIGRILSIDTIIFQLKFCWSMRRARVRYFLKVNERIAQRKKKYLESFLDTSAALGDQCTRASTPRRSGNPSSIGLQEHTVETPNSTLYAKTPTIGGCDATAFTSNLNAYSPLICSSAGNTGADKLQECKSSPGACAIEVMDDTAVEDDSALAQLECNVCYACPPDTPTSCYCGHIFCWGCAASWVNTMKNCPLCRTKCDMRDLWPVVHI